MSTSPEEQVDLDEMQKRLRVIYEGCITICIHYDRMTPEELKVSGNRSKEAMIVDAVRRAITKKNQALAAHIKKWPDK